MRLLLDVQVEGLKKYLESYGHTVFTATKEGVISDDKLLDYALKNDCVLITEDKKATKIAKVQGIKIVPVNVERIAKAVQQDLEKMMKTNNDRMIP